MRKLTENDITAIIGTTESGYKILKARVKGGGFSDSDHYGIVLGQNGRGHMVTWQFHLLEDEKPTYYWGHYLMEKHEAALEDYETRGQ